MRELKQKRQKRTFKLSEVEVSAVGEVVLTYNRNPDQEALMMRNVKITCSDDVYKFIRVKMEQHIEHVEGFYAIYLNRNNCVLGVHRVSMGGVSGTVADPKVILQAALLLNASGMMVAHNHPSGNLKPSTADISLTRKLKEASGLIDIVLLDHLIVTVDTYYSFADEGMI